MTQSLEQPTTLTPGGGNRRVPGWVRRAWHAVGPPVLGAGLGLLVGAGLILLAGADPIVAYGALLEGAFGGQRQLTETILKATPLLIMSLGLILAFKARVWNIGGEGQYFIGALFGSVIALQFSELPPALLITAMLLAGALGGALWGLIPALLRTKRGISEIISTLMLNYVAIFLIEYIARGPLKDPNGFLPETAQFIQAARLPRLLETRLHIGVIIALILIPVVYVLIWHTPLGFRLRAIGARASVARFAGINVEWGIIFALLFSGALAGLVGLMEVSYLHTRLKGAISGGYGFTGILVALLGRLHPVGALLAAIFFAALSIGANSMHTITGLPATLTDAIQAIVVLCVLGTDALFRLWRSG